MLHDPIGQFQHPPGERDVFQPHLLDSAKTTSISGMGVSYRHAIITPLDSTDPSTPLRILSFAKFKDICNLELATSGCIT